MLLLLPLESSVSLSISLPLLPSLSLSFSLSSFLSVRSRMRANSWIQGSSCLKSQGWDLRVHHSTCLEVAGQCYYLTISMRTEESPTFTGGEPESMPYGTCSPGGKGLIIASIFTAYSPTT